VIVRITTSKHDVAAMEMVQRFRQDGFCPFGKNGLLMGWIRQVEENEDKIILSVDVTEPKVIEYFSRLYKTEEYSS